MQGLPLFAGCKVRDLRRLNSLGTRISVAAGKRLMVAGTRGTEVAVVIHGVAACHVGVENVARFEAGDFFGEIAALDHRVRTATVTALTDMEILVLEAAEFEQMVRVVPDVAYRVLVTMAKRVRGANLLALAAS